ncbi:FAD-dependent oxidoreductase [Salmonella enterica]|nr:FAD-dependent oxidoreductase [Salmonella enterica]
MWVSDEVLRTHCRAQFKRLFGSQAATPLIDFIKDWSQDFYTATTADMNAVTHHAQAPNATPPSGPWRNRVMGIASEWSAQFPGYLAGAIEAAGIGVDKIIESRRSRKNIGDQCTMETRSE